MSQNARSGRQISGLILGPVLFIAVLSLPSPTSMTPEAHRAGAIAVLMATWWVTEAIPIAATALLPLALYPFMAVIPMKETVKPYADPNIFLFMGGFMIAMAMQKWGLHKRLALNIIRAIGGGPARMIIGFMAATAFLSMWVSNTATTVMMLPIAMAVIGQMQSEMDSTCTRRFGTALMLGIAYSASAGGVATLIGTPPNLIFAGQVVTMFPHLGEVSFIKWMGFALPLSIGFLAIIATYIIYRIARIPKGVSSNQSAINTELRYLGQWSLGEKLVMIIFVLTAVTWITQGDLEIGDATVQGWANRLGLTGIHAGTIAIAATILLFIIPVRLKDPEFLLDWTWASRIPWNVLLLFGGGFALATSFRLTGLAEWIAGEFLVLKGLPEPALIVTLCLGMTFLTEVTSNTATSSMILPVLGATAVSIGTHPYLLMIPATISASFAFMMPVATPPNAIVFGSGYVTIPQMAKAGIVLNILGAFWVTFIILTLGKFMLGI